MTHAVMVKFSYDFGLVLPILRRFLPLLGGGFGKNAIFMEHAVRAVVMEIMQWQDWE